MPGILQPKGEKEEDGKVEVEEGVVKEKPGGNGATENSVQQERENSCVSCSSPEAGKPIDHYDIIACHVYISKNFSRPLICVCTDYQATRSC